MCNIFDDETCFVKMKPLPKEDIFWEISDFRITHIGITASILKMMHLRRTYHSRRIGDALRQFAQFATTTTPEDKKPTLPPPTNPLVKHGPGVVAAAAVRQQVSTAQNILANYFSPFKASKVQKVLSPAFPSPFSSVCPYATCQACNCQTILLQD